MANEGAFFADAGNSIIQFGVARKTAVEAVIRYAQPFGDLPTVVVSPFWERQSSEVGHSETIGRVGREEFAVFSGNAASNYFVSWIAVGQAEGRGSAQFPDRVQTRDLRIQFGNEPKASVTASPRFTNFPHLPNVQVSPFWNGRRTGVGHAETIGDVTLGSFDTLSDNRASDYRVSWIATGRMAGAWPPTDRPDRWDEFEMDEFELGDVVIRTGRLNKIGSVVAISLGVRRDGLPGPPFGAPPVVVVSPFWQGQGRGVTHAETLNFVDAHAFGVASGNGASNYFVSWIAIGPKP